MGGEELHKSTISAQAEGERERESIQLSIVSAQTQHRSFSDTKKALKRGRRPGYTFSPILESTKEEFLTYLGSEMFLKA